MKKILSIFLFATLGGGAALFINYLILKPTAFENSSKQQSPIRLADLTSSAGTIDFRAAAEQTVHAVVHIKTKFTSQQTYYDPFQGFLVVVVECK